MSIVVAVVYTVKCIETTKNTKIKHATTVVCTSVMHTSETKASYMHNHTTTSYQQ